MKRPPSHALLRRAIVTEVARATRAQLEPLLAAGYSWDDIGDAILKGGSQGALAPTSAKRPFIKLASGSDRGASLGRPRVKAFAWYGRSSAPIKTN